jgi:hypothetical protein
VHPSQPPADAFLPLELLMSRVAARVKRGELLDPPRFGAALELPQLPPLDPRPPSDVVLR